MRGSSNNTLATKSPSVMGAPFYLCNCVPYFIVGGGEDVKTRALLYKQKWADELAKWLGFGYSPSQDFAFKRTV